MLDVLECGVVGQFFDHLNGFGFSCAHAGKVDELGNGNTGLDVTWSKSVKSQPMTP